MGKLGRTACIFTPLALTIASLTCILLIFLGQTNPRSPTLSSLYFLRADLSNFTATPSATGGLASSALANGLFSTAKASGLLADIYTVGLWNYCAGDVGAAGNGTSGVLTNAHCSPRQAAYWFDPVAVWGLNGTGVQKVLPAEWQDGLRTYAVVAKWAFVAWVVAFWATVAALGTAALAVCSRWGSFATTIVASISALFALAAATTSTALYATLIGTLDATLRPYNIALSLSPHTLAVIWLAAAFALAADLFWLFSTCCVSGRSVDKRSSAGAVGGAPYPYERVPSPYAGNANAPPAYYQGQGYGAYVGEGKKGGVKPSIHKSFHNPTASHPPIRPRKLTPITKRLALGAESPPKAKTPQRFPSFAAPESKCKKKKKKKKRENKKKKKEKKKKKR